MDQKQFYFTIRPMLQSKLRQEKLGNINIILIDNLIKDIAYIVENFANKVCVCVFFVNIPVGDIPTPVRNNIILRLCLRFFIH